jgi:hypothetical protein
MFGTASDHATHAIFGLVRQDANAQAYLDGLTTMLDPRTVG